jgi:hypothetical protein
MAGSQRKGCQIRFGNRHLLARMLKGTSAEICDKRARLKPPLNTGVAFYDVGPDTSEVLGVYRNLHRAHDSRVEHLHTEAQHDSRVEHLQGQG